MAAWCRDDAGVSTIEVAFLAPLMVAMLTIIVVLGIMVNTHGVVEEAARDAARAGSLQGDTSAANPDDPSADHTEARRQAMAAAEADLGNKCAGGLTDADFTTRYIPAGNPPGPGLQGIAYYQVTIKCSVDTSLLSMFGVSKVLTESFTAPINTFQADTAGAG